MRKVTRKQAEDAVGEAHQDQFPTRGFREDYPNHFLRWEDNLSSDTAIEWIEHDYGGGSGNELKGEPPKFCAAYSSSALCANSFAPARENPSWLQFGDFSGFSEFLFEWKLKKSDWKSKTGSDGNPPNFDFVATIENRILAVESKYLETLEQKTPKFSDVYREAFANCGCPVLERVYRSILAGDSEFHYLDAAQLLKHALGVIHYSTPEGNPVEERTLGYVFWEPENHTELKPYCAHGEELTIFEQLIQGSEVKFVSMSYPTLWESWLQDPDTEEHANTLIERYSLSL